MRHLFKHGLAAAALLALVGCATQQPVHMANADKFKAADPRSILVVPAVNRAVDVNAPDYFLTTITRPLAERGYYVFPVNMVKRVMEDDGLGDANLVLEGDTRRLADIFHADAVLYVVVERWDAQYAVFSTTVTVELSYLLKSGRTGEVLWKANQKYAYTPNAQSQGGGIIGALVAKAVTAAMTKAAPNYRPIAVTTNALALDNVANRMPYGPYDARYEPGSGAGGYGMVDVTDSQMAATAPAQAEASSEVVVKPLPTKTTPTPKAPAKPQQAEPVRSLASAPASAPAPLPPVVSAILAAADVPADPTPPVAAAVNPTNGAKVEAPVNVATPVEPVTTVAPVTQSAAPITPPPAAATPIAAPNAPRTLGTWSYEVEQQALGANCEGDGAWIVNKGDLDTYQVDCHDGRHFVMQCDAVSCHQPS